MHDVPAHMTNLTIAPPLVRQLDRLAMESYPDECCGALVGHAERVFSVRPTVNAHPGPRTERYAIAVGELLQVHRAARRRGLEVVGYFHSHPDGRARPSARDRAVALPGVSYLILAVSADRVVERRVWMLVESESRFSERGLV